MRRYIDADYFARQIEDVIKSQRYDELVTCEKKFPTVADVLATVVDELRGKSLNGFELCPTADVVEVVRCKECKNNQNPRTSGNADCELFYGMTDQEGFCSYGERREE